MPRLFVFGIGGTGARVIKSLTLLLAAGVQTNGYEIVPIIIDPHKDLPELKDCKNLMRLYKKIHNSTYKDGKGNEKGLFFHSNMISLNEIMPEVGPNSFDQDERIDASFGDLIAYNTLAKGDVNRDLIDLLYTEGTLRTPLSVGFKGNPNIGTVVLNNFEDAAWYKSFESILDAEDRVFIVSSIFGGTGASGFPLLVKTLRESSNPTVKNIVIGALPVMPYFKLTEPDSASNHKEIDSNNFFTKTKSALSYYDKNLTGVNALYYVADPTEQSTPYINNEESQDNKAHLVELIGASGILDFLNKDFTKIDSNHYDYALKEDANTIDFKNLGDELRDLIDSELTNYLVFTKLNPLLKSFPDAAINKNELFNDQFYRSDFVRDLEEFNVRYFSKWLSELSENERKFKPFNLSTSTDALHLLKVGSPIKNKTLFGLKNRRFDTSNFINRMETLRSKYKHIPIDSKASKYLALLNGAIIEVLNEEYNK
ncbi:FtsZ/tubulin family protein [Pedobacter gandavensis]|uniref:Tubulin/FtsZ GTPase domain-containing protein n=1 Tax=Pedobacter gandavensis TaxID=2679963 RepID=A0ABR6EQS0_9SPHI|nr:hypothetical protein [Pedobacter gandavensis]MBB2147595.1 hypothetical protein [Pedobacter gandavensis]